MTDINWSRPEHSYVEEVYRKRILMRLTDLLEQIAVGPTSRPRIKCANDAVTDLSGRVLRGRLVFGERDPLPMLSILEVPIPLDQVAPAPDSSYSKGTWELLVQGFVEDDPNHPTDPAHDFMAATKKVLADEKKRMLREQKFLGFKSIEDVNIGAGVVRPPDEVSDKAYFWLNISLTFSEDLSDPFEIDD